MNGKCQIVNYKGPEETMLDSLAQMLRYLLVCVLMLPLLGGAILAAPFSNTLARKLVRAWNLAFLAVFKISYEVHFEAGANQLDEGGIIVGLNQQSLIDPTVGFASWEKPVNAIWNFEYALIPFFGWISFFLGWVIVRQSPSQAKRQIEKAAACAAYGGLVFLSIEGRRSPDGQLSPYKKGPVVMALAAQVPIHPAYMTGTGACMPAVSQFIQTTGQPSACICESIHAGSLRQTTRSVH